jgi:CHAD domain-containing protein
MTTAANAYPLRTLQQHVTDLDATILLCLADPTAQPVHRLRTLSRRVEAQLAMLTILKVRGLRTEAAREAQRLLKKLRRAAGEVRDLDVQGDRIAGYIGNGRPPSVTKEARELTGILAKRRERSARKLVKTLHRHDTDLVLALRSLIKALPTPSSLILSPHQLTEVAENWFTHNAPVLTATDDDLHSLRKTAKLSRYLAENAPKEAESARLAAKQFENLQESGGEWHDWLLLTQIARNELGDSSELAALFSRREKLALAKFRRLIDDHKAPQPPRSKR